eukprot:1617591-Lingulodinium_polyedra.AAC.1
MARVGLSGGGGRETGPRGRHVLAGAQALLPRHRLVHASGSSRHWAGQLPPEHVPGHRGRAATAPGPGPGRNTPGTGPSGAV